jgi:phosphoadenosine phosphosulfate reductase
VTSLDTKGIDVAALDAQLNDAAPAEIIRAAVEIVGRENLALV